jgi:alkylation response protein AidB-like acyl-CoA dehydrogenase
VDRDLYTAEHEAFRDVVRRFVEREVAPNLERWDEQRVIDRSTWLAAGNQGIVGLSGPEEYGGGVTDYRYRHLVQEEFGKVGASALTSSFALQDDIVVPYFVSLASPDQAQRWLPGMCRGELIGAIAMTEPGTGSDLRGIRTSGTKVDGGWLVNGAKTFITSGSQADIVVVVTKTSPESGAEAFSLLVVEEGMAGFTRGRKLAKIGMHAQDTAELFFSDVFVPEQNLLGVEGGGLRQLMAHLPLERLSIASAAMGAADAAFAWAVEYVQQRHAFGRRIADFQNTQFVLAEVATELDVTRAYVDRCVLAVSDGRLTAVEAAKAKWWATDVQNRVIDRLLQLFGGYGYMAEYPISRAWADARVQKIYGGTNEIMKHIIAREIVAGR